ncbi:DUF6497 family protein [Algirhabdus cladophorae]|uniref:DUF6497 family protein n=1 Tax=Algirhabdus cladophorae TaxID=3377108 RepID=UPI003B8491D7
MIRIGTVLALSFGIASPLAAMDLAVPSGQNLEFVDRVVEPDVTRFRFLAPEIDPVSGGLGYADVAEDFGILCQGVALPDVRAMDEMPKQIVISMMSAQTPFGEANPQVTQFFEVFSVQNDACIWEQF